MLMLKTSLRIFSISSCLSFVSAQNAASMLLVFDQRERIAVYLPAYNA